MIIRVTQRPAVWKHRTAVIAPLPELYDMQSFGLLDSIGYHQAMKRSVISLQKAVEETEGILRKFSWSAYGESK